jgi:2-amino-4-hydroxy-6-hydroxymethyldihydropteridine diphosphokinase
MNRLYLSVASNIQPETNIIKAIGLLKDLSRLLAVSRCFVTDAIPAANRIPSNDLPCFINCVVLVETTFSARAFKFEILRPLERNLGRIRTEDRYAPRPIDLDILSFNSEIIVEDGLAIPDPDIYRRWFLAQGILDIDSDAVLPDSPEPFSIHLASVSGESFLTNRILNENAELRRGILELIDPEGLRRSI